MEIFICESCSTLATVEMVGNTIQITKCECQTRKEN